MNVNVNVFLLVFNGNDCGGLMRLFYKLYAFQIWPPRSLKVKTNGIVWLPIDFLLESDSDNMLGQHLGSSATHPCPWPILLKI